MRESEKNKVYQFFKDEHFVLLTGKEIDEIEELILETKATEEKVINRIVTNNINVYRYINISLCLLLFFMPDLAVNVIISVYIAVNIYLVVKTKLKTRINGV